MVPAVCRRVAHGPHDADDAFQATFLVLARTAGSLAEPERLAVDNWLYGVACRTATRARAEAARRRVHERQVTGMPSAAARDRRVPQRYYSPITRSGLFGNVSVSRGYFAKL